MEFASRRTGARAGGLASLLAVLTLAGGGACRRPGARPPGHDGAAGRSPAAADLLGRVTDEADRPLPEARVLALGPLSDAAQPSRREARADLGGRFRFEGLPRGRYALVVEALGLASIEPPALDVPSATPVVVRLSGQGRSLAGTVVVAGAPVAGARVRLGGAGSPLGRATLSDESGRFVFHGLGAGDYALRATKGLLSSPVVAAVAPADGGPAATADAGAPASPVRLELAAGLGVVGVVVDDGGRGLPGAEVRAERAPDDPLGDAAVTKPDGRFQLGPLPPGRYRVVARAPGYLLRAPGSVALAAAASAPAQRLEFVRAASAEGRLADARGAPVAGAEIRAGGAGAALTDLAVIFEPLPLAAEAAALPGAAGVGRGATKVARTDAAGAFRLDDLLPGPLRLAITRAPFAPLATETVSLAPGEHRDLGVLTLRDATTVDAGAPQPAPLQAPADATLTGVARDDGGRPLAHARVRAFPVVAAADALGAPPRSPPLATAAADPGGHFTLAGVPRGPVLLELTHPSYPTTYATATADSVVTLTAPVPGGIDGEVREHVLGAPIPRATVEALGPNGQRATATATKGDASFRMLRLAPGHWTLTARAPGYRSTVRDVDVAESPTLGETSVRGFRIELDLDR
jgi:hypothetical protein